MNGVLGGANIDEAESKRESAPERERERRDEREIGRDRKRGRYREKESDGGAIPGGAVSK